MPPPPSPRRRLLLQRPELAEAWQWSRTSDDLAADPELELWLSEDFDVDASVGLVVRAELPDDGADALALIGALRPRPHEVFPVPIRTARAALARVQAEAARGDTSAGPAGVLIRGGDVRPMEWSLTRDTASPRLAPGDIVVLDTRTPLFTADGEDSPPVLVPADHDVRRHCAADRLEARATLGTLWEEQQVGEIVHRIELADPACSDVLQDLTVPGEADPDLGVERLLVSAWLAAHPGGPMRRAAGELLATDRTGKDSNVVVQRGDDDVPIRVLVIDTRRASADEDLRQEWTPARSRDAVITLDDHQAAVTDRVGHLARSLGLRQEVTDALVCAAAHHDDGKSDPRFQHRLGARVGEVLAKSRAVTPEGVRRREARAGLPPRWRHEQRSVWEAWHRIPEELDRELVARLIGTSHGHGRAGFPHTAAELLETPDAVATELFDVGLWDELIERTEQRYGVWGCAFLESVLRAADGCVSSEGR